ncbi:hypothetical protein, partial sequence, partial [Candidatus Phytoplasma solani]
AIHIFYKTPRIEYDQFTHKRTKETFYNPVNQTINIIYEYDNYWGTLTKKTRYAPNDQTIWYIKEYDKITKKKTKSTFFRPDGTTVDYIHDFDRKTGDYLKTYCTQLPLTANPHTTTQPQNT